MTCFTARRSAALSVALAAKEAYHFLGSPEGELAIAEAVIYLATAPKSTRGDGVPTHEYPGARRRGLPSRKTPARSALEWW